MRKPAALLAGCLLATAGGARAEIALMSSGKILYIDDYHRQDDRITLYLTGGGEVTISSKLVANIVPNEIRPEDKEEGGWTSLPLLPQWGRLITPTAERYGIDPKLVAALIWVESSGDARAVSRKGARGLMQLMPETARKMGVRDAFDPAQNVKAGVRYLKKLLDRNSQDLELALAAYNAGPSAVDRHGGVPPYPETRAYVRRVLNLYRADASDTR